MGIFSASMWNASQLVTCCAVSKPQSQTHRNELATVGLSLLASAAASQWCGAGLCLLIAGYTLL